ncbi:MAG: HEPN domain-containing protein [Candidatus Brocadia sp. AMX2]|uniref:HEPN domain-containing protein n=1 Tax=Candidatus Brocadia sinica TaxID=795830 RepID=UPI0009E4B3C6|nr:HEPN domain-containing protein [Candidatus Brocadia sinica]KAA0242386.1 MAG: HEPN domain-containing protein [Candidatus Brocadia sp. AMX2]MBC6934026.1 HEPN domain-containing protein [Candidatus Brocadia sp.]MBL1170567.1 HEPN domain-containing protein [Candidatus Brocadia sp. AMX1]MCE7868336.1 HEPN domain-containing protein [Candidatus Brocadia sp. AMX2]MCK6468672.1 HEPN domain-containing protein [Candidatus Brocadia sinica]
MSFWRCNGFHLHHSAEKYFKAFIVAHDLEFEKIHNLISLLKICSKKEPVLSSLLSGCEFLNTSYIDTRYPVHWPTNYTKEKSLKAREVAVKIGETIKELLKRLVMFNQLFLSGITAGSIYALIALGFTIIYKTV